MTVQFLYIRVNVCIFVQMGLQSFDSVVKNCLCVYNKRNAVQETLNDKETKCMKLKEAFLLVGCQFYGES